MRDSRKAHKQNVNHTATSEGAGKTSGLTSKCCANLWTPQILPLRGERSTDQQLCLWWAPGRSNKRRRRRRSRLLITVTGEEMWLLSDERRKTVILKLGFNYRPLILCVSCDGQCCVFSLDHRTFDDATIWVFWAVLSHFLKLWSMVFNLALAFSISHLKWRLMLSRFYQLYLNLSESPVDLFKTRIL